MPLIDPANFALQNSDKPVRFARSSRAHRIGRARMLQVLASPAAIWLLPPVRPDELKFVLVGEDNTARKFELIVIATANDLLVIHAMDLRKKWRWLDEIS